MICDEAHTALGEKTSAAIRSFSEPVYIGMTATEQLIAKQVSDVFPASVDDLPLADAARRGLIAPLRCLRVPPAAAINSVPIVGGDFEERALAAALDHSALNRQPPASTGTGSGHPGHRLRRRRRARVQPRAGVPRHGDQGRGGQARRRRCRLAETLAAYERGEINVLINAQLLAEGWNSPRATVCFHLAPTASRRVYQQRIGRIMRMHPRKEAGIVVDFVTKGATHNDRVISLHSLLDADFYREGARVTPAPRRRQQRRARRRLSPVPWLVPVTPDVARRLAVIQREWQRVDPKFLDSDEQGYWATIAGRQIRFDQRAEFAQKFVEGRAGKGALETFLAVCAAENPNRRLRMTALADRVATPVERADFDDLVTLVTQAPPWEKDRAAGVRILLRAIGDGKATARSRFSLAGRGSWHGRRARFRTGVRARSSRRPSGCSARSRTPAATATRTTSRSSSRLRRRCRLPSVSRCSHPPRATPRAPTRSSMRPARSSARSRRSQPRSPRTCPHRRPRPASRDGAGRSAGPRDPHPRGQPPRTVRRPRRRREDPSPALPLSVEATVSAAAENAA